MTEHHSSKAARARGKDRSRQQALRDRRKAAGAPGTHTLNRAIAHAFLSEVKLQRREGEKLSLVPVSAGRVLARAFQYLTEGTHGGNSYSEKAVHAALVSRVRRDAWLDD